MNDHDYKIKNYEIIRRRWDSEDNLLVSRTGVFLTVNSIFFAASQLQDNLTFKIGVTILSLVISFLWLTTSWHSFNVIARLYREAEKYMPEEAKCIYKIKPVFVRPNTVFGKLLPIVLILAWIVYLAWCIRNMGVEWFSLVVLLLLGLIFSIMYAEYVSRKNNRKLKSAEPGT